VFFLLVVRVRLSVPAQLIDWKVSEMTYNVLMGTFNPTHSLTHAETGTDTSTNDCFQPLAIVGGGNSPTMHSLR